MNPMLTKKRPEKHLTRALVTHAGRNFTGRITVRHKGGGVKHMYRIVDFGQEKLDIAGRVVALEYDPNRSAYLALVGYDSGDKRYIIASHGIKVGDMVMCAPQTDIKIGNRMMLKHIPVGIEIFNIELEPNKGGKMVRSAGAVARVMAHEGGFAQLEMPSKEVRRVRGECYASIGQASHPEYRFESYRTAGSKRRSGWRPTVRGSAMNPCDHPHGGGEGRTSIGLRHPKTPWGKPASGVRTRNRNKWTSKLIIKRRHK